MKVKIRHWNAVASWTWVANDENCGICRMPFNGCCPDCKVPGDDCPLVWEARPPEETKGLCLPPPHIHCPGTPEQRQLLKSGCGSTFPISIHPCENCQVTGRNILSFSWQMVSVIDHQQPKEFQQLLIFWVNEVSRLLPAVILQIGVSTQRKKFQKHQFVERLLFVLTVRCVGSRRCRPYAVESILPHPSGGYLLHGGSIALHTPGSLTGQPHGWQPCLRHGEDAEEELIQDTVMSVVE